MQVFATQRPLLADNVVEDGMAWTTGIVSASEIITASSSIQPSAVRWGRISDQHGSSVEVPLSMLQRKVDPEGAVYTAHEGAVRIELVTVTEPRPGFPGNDPQGDMDLKRSDCTTWPPAYHVLKPQLAAYSCVKADKVTYYVARYGRFGSVSLLASYPQAEAAFWNKAVARMSESMRQVERHETR